jgi:hypothetical protein
MLREYFIKFQELIGYPQAKHQTPGNLDSMYRATLDGKASLFIAFLGDNPISYLFCGCFRYGFRLVTGKRKGL